MARSPQCPGHEVVDHEVGLDVVRGRIDQLHRDPGPGVRVARRGCLREGPKVRELPLHVRKLPTNATRLQSQRRDLRLDVVELSLRLREVVATPRDVLGELGVGELDELAQRHRLALDLRQALTGLVALANHRPELVLELRDVGGTIRIGAYPPARDRGIASPDALGQRAAVRMSQ